MTKMVTNLSVCLQEKRLSRINCLHSLLYGRLGYSMTMQKYPSVACIILFSGKNVILGSHKNGKNNLSYNLI